MGHDNKVKYVCSRATNSKRPLISFYRISIKSENILTYDLDIVIMETVWVINELSINKQGTLV